jgi:hypothetical protein
MRRYAAIAIAAALEMVTPFSHAIDGLPPTCDEVHGPSTNFRRAEQYC